MQQRSQRQSQRRKEKQRSEARQNLSMGDLRDRIGGETGRAKRPERAAPISGARLNSGCGPFPKVFHQRTDQLETEHRQDEEDADDFARAALRKPALQPREDRLHEDEVEEREASTDRAGPRETERGART